MAPRRLVELYRLAVVLGAVGLFVIGLPRFGFRAVEWWLLASLLIAGVLARRFPLRISLGQKVSVDSAVFFAAVLLLPAWQAAALVAVTQAIDVVIAASLKLRASKEKLPLGEVGLSLLFNAGQLYISTLAAALCLGLAGVSAHSAVSNTAVAYAVGAAVLMYGLNVLLVSAAVAISSGRSILTIFLNTHHAVGVQFASLYLLGAVVAFAAVRFPWVAGLSLLPAALAYTSMKRRIQLTYTFQHSQRVAAYSKAIGRKLGLSPAEVELVELSAKVHDIGKIRIPDSILLKPDRLTEAERRVMETHPRLGFEILSQFSAYEKVLELVLTHHERYDGRGYPNRTVGHRSLLVAQVIPVADSLDAMTTTRAYRNARSWDSAMNELKRGAGTQWNPKVVEAALVALSGWPQEERERAGSQLRPASA